MWPEIRRATATALRPAPHRRYAPEPAAPAPAPTPVEQPKHVVAMQPHRPAATHGHAPAIHEAHPAAAVASPPAVEGARDCILSVASFPWADLWIDGKDTGQRTPVVHYPVSCGAHKLALKRHDLKIDRNEQVMVAPGHELKQHYDLGGDDTE
jgi:hypothetical protein